MFYLLSQQKKSIAVIKSDIVDSSLSVFTLGREGSSMSFCQIAQKVGTTFMTLNNLELRHNARGNVEYQILNHLST